MANKTFWNAENRARLDAMVRKGALLVSLEKAAEILGTSFSTVHTEITRRGIKPSGRHTFEWTPARRKMLRAMLDDEGKFILPRGNAAKIIGCDRSTLITGLIALEGSAPSFVNLASLKAMATKDATLTLPLHDAARKLGCSRTALRNAMRKLGLRGAGRFEWTADKTALLQSMLRTDGRLKVPNDAAARRIGCSVRALQYRLAETGKQNPVPEPARREEKPKAEPTAAGAVLIVMRRWLPRLAPMQVSAAVTAEPELAGMGEERIGHRLRALAKIYGVTESASLQMALSAPGMFVADLSVLRRNLREAAAAIGLDAKTYAHLTVKKPALALIDGATMDERIGLLSNLLHADRDKTLSLARRNPNLLAVPSDDLLARRKALAAALRLPEKTIATAVRRKPNILFFSSAVLAGHCRDLTERTGQSHDAVARAFIASPALLQVKPETIDANADGLARLLGCNKAHIMASFFAKPVLLTIRPAHIAERVGALTRIFEVTREVMMEVLLKYPYLLTFATDNTAEKAGLLVKLSEALGKPATPAEILAQVPMAYSYAKERIAARVEMAREGIGLQSIGAMLSMPEEKAVKLRSQRPERIEA